MEKVSFGSDIPGYVYGPHDEPSVVLLQVSPLTRLNQHMHSTGMLANVQCIRLVLKVTMMSARASTRLAMLQVSTVF